MWKQKTCKTERHEALIAVNVNITAFWDVMPHSLIYRN